MRYKVKRTRSRDTGASPQTQLLSFEKEAKNLIMEWCRSHHSFLLGMGMGTDKERDKGHIRERLSPHFSHTKSPHLNLDAGFVFITGLGGDPLAGVDSVHGLFS